MLFPGPAFLSSEGAVFLSGGFVSMRKHSHNGPEATRSSVACSPLFSTGAVVLFNGFVHPANAVGLTTLKVQRL